MTVRQAMERYASMLAKAGIDAPQYEARLLFDGLAGLDRLRLMEQRSRELTETEEKTMTAAVNRRCSGEPIQYILGKWEFMGREYLVGEGVLIPRDDTEVCVRACLDGLRGRKSPEVLELCSGSGIIAVTVAKNIQDSRVTAVEKEEAAFRWLEKNIAYNRAENVNALAGDIFLCYDGFADGSFDALVSNPPYIEASVVPTLQREVLHEPKTALDGGADGLDFYRCIAEKWSGKLRAGGCISLEIGETQSAAVTKLLDENGFVCIRTHKDIQGLDRAVSGVKL